MRIYPEGAAALIKVDFFDEADVAFSPVSVAATLKDEHGENIAMLGIITPAPGAVSAEFLVPGVHNTVTDRANIEVRILHLAITREGGAQTERSVVYGVEAEETLQICVNSFQTWPRAQVEAARLINLETFNAEFSDARRKYALIEAYNRISNLRLTYSTTVGHTVRWHTLDADEWDLFSADAFTTQLPSRLQRALIQAQLIEADEILQGNVLARKISSGIQSETIGESSVTLRVGAGGAGMANGISSFTMSVLAPFMDNTIRIARA